MTDKNLREASSAPKKKLIELAQQNHQKYFAQFKKRIANKPAEIQAAGKPFFTKFDAALKNDPQYKAYYNELTALQSQLKILLPAYQRNPKENAAALRNHRSQLEALNKRYQTMHTTALNTAGGRPFLDQCLAEQVEKWRKGPSLDQPVISGRPPLIDMSSQRPSIDRDFLFTPPYEVPMTYIEGNHLTAIKSASSNPATGALQTEAVAYEAGFASSTAMVGNFFVLPENPNTRSFYRFTLKFTLDLHITIEAIASTGAAGADADAVVMLVYPDLGPGQFIEHRLESALSIGIWADLKKKQKIYEVEMDGLFNPGPERNMLFYVGMRSSSWATGVVASAPCRMTGNLTDISLQIRD